MSCICYLAVYQFQGLAMLFGVIILQQININTNTLQAPQVAIEQSNDIKKDSPQFYSRYLIVLM